jgi:16S rRNA (guanine(966)-N(2))-methyltransferase RsmD
VKEALFDMLPLELSGRRALDLFAGTGSLSLEALSRGAGEAVLVESSPRAVRLIRENLRSLGFQRRARVRQAPALRALRVLSRAEERFDLVFLDPPYEKGWVEKVLTILGGADLVREGGIVAAEHSRREPVREGYGSLRLERQKRYGETLLSFFRRVEEERRPEEERCSAPA